MQQVQGSSVRAGTFIKECEAYGRGEGKGRGEPEDADDDTHVPCREMGDRGEGGEFFVGQSRYIIWEYNAQRRGGREGGSKGGIGGLNNTSRGVGRHPDPMVMSPWKSAVARAFHRPHRRESKINLDWEHCTGQHTGGGLLAERRASRGRWGIIVDVLLERGKSLHEG